MTKTYPSPIYSNLPGTWAYSTVTLRLPDIAGRVIEENHFPDQINLNLSRLQEDINQGSIRSLLDQGAPDQEAWESYLEPFLGQSWLDVPWFFAEHYFYRRIMEAVDYFREGLDPFGFQKREGLEKTLGEIQSLGKFLQERLAVPENVKETVREGIYFALWGNQADLSLWPAGSEGDPKHDSQKTLQEHLLANDMPRLMDLLCGSSQVLPRVDLMLDNAGFELITDLALADILLGLGLVQQVYLLAKAHPTFVSDVIPVDVDEAVDFLMAQDHPPTRAFGARLSEHLRADRLVVQKHFFWNSPLMMWELPDEIREDWGNSSLVISKGDANYRRLLGDRQWEFTVPFSEAVDYLPLPLAALRTLKAELAAGLDPAQIRLAEKADPTWMVDGRWGVIHFSEGNREE
jgi:uncharacterized protein with ATP-grasp and redox domains